MNIHQIASFCDEGNYTIVTCRYCGNHLSPNFINGQGTVGYSGHDDNCDAILAGITIDYQKEQDKIDEAKYRAMTPEQRLTVDLKKILYNDLLKFAQESYK